MNALLEDERIAELLATQATDRLDADDAAELERLLAAHPGADREALDRVAAALCLAGSFPVDEPLPPALAARVRADGEAWVAAHGRGAARPAPAAGTPAAARPVAPVADLAAARAQRATPAAPAPVTGGSRAGWWAAAAALVLAVAGWYPRFAGEPAAPTAGAGADAPSGAAGTPPVAAPAAPRGAAEERAALLAAAAQRLVRWDWAATEDPAAAAGVSGDVVWDPVTQRGYMRFVGLRPNDANAEQYQLWIFDAERDERFPVDGGVFDVSAGGEVIVPIDARLAVAKPVLFAVTVEKPGGVVVSARERIVTLAKAEA